MRVHMHVCVCVCVRKSVSTCLGHREWLPCFVVCFVPLCEAVQPGRPHQLFQDLITQDLVIKCKTIIKI